MDMSEVAAFKRKLCFSRKGGKKKGKVQFEEDEPEDLFEDNSDSDSPHGSPLYAESQDSSSASSDNEDDDDDVEGDKGDGGAAYLTKEHGAGASGSTVRGSSGISKPHMNALVVNGDAIEAPMEKIWSCSVVQVP
nr:unnamed protein product [Digitaria exilis]CAB3498352.1 unnamed protein product [Digitaria exilis]